MNYELLEKKYIELIQENEKLKTIILAMNNKQVINEKLKSTKQFENEMIKSLRIPDNLFNKHMTI